VRRSNKSAEHREQNRQDFSHGGEL
jgi:hypothetical protein